MSCKWLILLITLSLPGAVTAQLAAPTAKPVKSAPVVVPHAPPVIATVPSANRTIELLKNAGVIPTNIGRPIVLSARSPYVDELTFLSVRGGSSMPAENYVGMSGVGYQGAYPTQVGIAWNPDPTKRYVLDCAFDSDDARVNFSWRPQGGRVLASISGGHAGVVLPADVTPPVTLTTAGEARLVSCEVTPIG